MVCFGATLVDISITIDVMKMEEPRREQTPKRILSEVKSSLLVLAAAMAEKTSGAPFPNASRVTPANDSESPNFLLSASKDGDKY